MFVIWNKLFIVRTYVIFCQFKYIVYDLFFV